MRKKKHALYAIVITLFVLVLIVGSGSMYMLSYSLSPDPNRHDTDSAYNVLYGHMPDMRAWTDSVRESGALRDTFVVMPSGERHHALYLRADSASGHTAVIVHGYKDCAVKFLHLGRMYHRDLGYNIIMPDLHAHGLSEGDDIQMGWKDRNDVRHWIEIASKMFSVEGSKADIVVHGVSMGAATTMCLSGDSLPENVRCFIEDCGYTSVWDEFSLQLKEQFSLPSFPLMQTTSLLCKILHGWSFSEASPLRQVARCRRPMLFIHGDADTFVPFSMMRPLYDAKPQPKEKLIAHGSEHAKAYNDHMEEYTSAVRLFLDKYNKP